MAGQSHNRSLRLGKTEEVRCSTAGASEYDSQFEGILLFGIGLPCVPFCWRFPRSVLSPIFSKMYRQVWILNWALTVYSGGYSISWSQGHALGEPQSWLWLASGAEKHNTERIQSMLENQLDYKV